MLTTSDGRVPREIGRQLRAQERKAKAIKREHELDMRRAANLRRASSLPLPKLGPRIAR